MQFPQLPPVDLPGLPDGEVEAIQRVDPWQGGDVAGGGHGQLGMTKGNGDGFDGVPEIIGIVIDRHVRVHPGHGPPDPLPRRISRSHAQLAEGFRGGLGILVFRGVFYAEEHGDRNLPQRPGQGKAPSRVVVVVRVCRRCVIAEW